MLNDDCEEVSRIEEATTLFFDTHYNDVAYIAIEPKSVGNSSSTKEIYEYQDKKTDMKTYASKKEYNKFMCPEFVKYLQSNHPKLTSREVSDYGDTIISNYGRHVQSQRQSLREWLKDKDLKFDWIEILDTFEGLSVSELPAERRNEISISDVYGVKESKMKEETPPDKFLCDGTGQIMKNPWQIGIDRTQPEGIYDKSYIGIHESLKNKPIMPLKTLQKDIKQFLYKQKKARVCLTAAEKTQIIHALLQDAYTHFVSTADHKDVAQFLSKYGGWAHTYYILQLDDDSTQVQTTIVHTKTPISQRFVSQQEKEFDSYTIVDVSSPPEATVIAHKKSISSMIPYDVHEHLRQYRPDCRLSSISLNAYDYHTHGNSDLTVKL